MYKILFFLSADTIVIFCPVLNNISASFAYWLIVEISNACAPEDASIAIYRFPENVSLATALFVDVLVKPDFTNFSPTKSSGAKFFKFSNVSIEVPRCKTISSGNEALSNADFISLIVV
jgi:hypothetical protein